MYSLREPGAYSFLQQCTLSAFCVLANSPWIKELVQQRALENQLQFNSAFFTTSELSGAEMHSILSSTAYIALATALATAPAVENNGSRSVLYWVIVPSLVVSVVAIFSHTTAF